MPSPDKRFDHQLAQTQIADLLERQLGELAQDQPTHEMSAEDGSKVTILTRDNLMNAASHIVQGWEDLGRGPREVPTLLEVAALIDRLNDAEMTRTGACHWSVSYCYGDFAVEWHGIVLWFSDEDEREQLGGCGGDGKADPREPLEDYLRRQLAELRASMVG